MVGLARRGVHIGNNFLRRLYWSRPLSTTEAEQSAVEIQDYDEDKVLLDSAVKGSDGFFTTFFVSTWSRYVARWAARVGLTPNQVTFIALCIGLLGATAFATGERAGYIAGAVLVYLSFVADCVDGQLARYTRTFSKFGAWLDSVFDRAKEYAAFAGLAIGADSPEVWALAAATLTLQTLRHSFDFSYGATDRQNIADTPQPPIAQSPDDAARAHADEAARDARREARGAALAAAPGDGRGDGRDDDDGDDEDATPPKGPRPLSRRILGFWRAFDRRIPGVVWIKKMAAFPIGERFAVICVTAAALDPRAPPSSSCSRGAASRCSTRRPADSFARSRSGGRCDECRDGGGQGSERIARGRRGARALPRRRAGLPRARDARTGSADSPRRARGRGPGRTAHPRGGRGRRRFERRSSRPVSRGSLSSAACRAAALTPIGSRGRCRASCASPSTAALLWIAANAGDSSHAAAFALIAALAFRHYDLVYRPRFQGVAPPAWLGFAAGGWDGRLVLAWVLLAVDALPAGMFIMAGVLGLAFVIECALVVDAAVGGAAVACTRTRRTRGSDRNGARRGRGQAAAAAHRRPAEDAPAG